METANYDPKEINFLLFVADIFYPVKVYCINKLKKA